MKTAEPSFSNHVRSLHRRIVAVRAKRGAVRRITGIAASLALLAGVFTVEACLDELVDLPWVARALIFACNLAGAGYLLWRDAIQPFRKQLNDDAVALMVEHAMPVFKSRFIASIQLARKTAEDAPHALVRALLAETAAAAAKLNFAYVVKTRRMMRALMAAAGVAVVAAGLATLGGHASLLLFKRAMLFNIPLPHKTNIVEITGDKKIGVGEDFKLEVTVAGVLPQSGTLVATTATGQSHQFVVGRDPARPGVYTAVIRSPQEAFTYQVKLNDDTSQTYHVTTMVRPAVAAVGCEQTYPPYVKLPPQKRSASDLTLLAGSKLRIIAKSSMPLAKAWVHLEGIDTEVPMMIDADKIGISGQIDIPAKGLTGFSLHLLSTEDVDSGKTVVYRIDVVPDREPTVKIIFPSRREELATEKARMLVAFEARDDFGVAKVDLHYTIDQGPEKVVPFDLGGHTDKLVARHYDWELGKFIPPLAVGNVIEFWITVADTNDVTGPGIGTSEHSQVKIVTPEEKRQDLANLMQDTINGVKEVSGSQEDLNKTLGEGIFEKPNP